MRDKNIIRKLRIDRIKLQVEILELERRTEMAYAANNPELLPYIKEAEKLIAHGKDLLEKSKP